MRTAGTATISATPSFDGPAQDPIGSRLLGRRLLHMAETAAMLHRAVASGELSLSSVEPSAAPSPGAHPIFSEAER